MQCLPDNISQNFTPASVVHEVEVVLHLEEDDEGGHDLPDGEPRQRVLVAHHQQLKWRSI